MSTIRRSVMLAAGLVLALALTAVVGYRVVAFTTGPVHDEEHRSFAAPARGLRIDADSGSIVIVSGTGPRVVVDSHTTGGLTIPRIDARLSGGALALEAGCPHVLSPGHCSAKIVVHVPPGLSVTAHNGSGDVIAYDLDGRLDLHTGSGDVDARDIHGDVSMSSSSGDVDAVRVGGDVMMHTSSGDVTAAALRASTVSASTSSGDVSLALASSPRRVDARTSSGDVVVTVPRRDRIAYDVRVDSGSHDQTVRVRTDPSSPRGIDARTGSGDVVVTYGAR